jgi:FkbM family methyltransferase
VSAPDLATLRIAQTVACHDADPIPKVPDAGQVIDRDGTRVQVMHNGVLIEEGCYHGAWMTEVIQRLRGHHEPQEEWAFHRVVERLRSDTPTPVMVELGSFWAYYSLWVKAAIPATQVILVEPDPHNLAVGRRNFALNGVEGRFIQAAVGLPDGAVVPFECESDGVVRDISLASLDGLMERQRLDRIDVVLCDTQGGELDALAGAAGALAARRIRFLVVSTHHYKICGDPLIHRKCLDLLESYGAHILTEHAVAESCSGDGLIVASLDDRDAGLGIEVTHARAQDTLFGGLEGDLATALAERDDARRRRDELGVELERVRSELDTVLADHHRHSQPDDLAQRLRAAWRRRRG